jgi:hypothetical protein
MQTEKPPSKKCKLDVEVVSDEFPRDKLEVIPIEVWVVIFELLAIDGDCSSLFRCALLAKLHANFALPYLYQ